MEATKSGETMTAQSPSDSSTVKKILHNALEHFSRFGYSGASVREITHASEVTKPTLYYYFKNKEELYKRLADSCFDEILRVVNDAAQHNGPTVERATKIVREYCRLCEEKFSVVRFVHLMLMAAERQAPDVGVHQFADKVRHHFRSIVQDGVSRGELKAERAESTIYSVTAIFNLRVESILNKFPTIPDFSVIEESIRTVLNH